MMKERNPRYPKGYRGFFLYRTFSDFVERFYTAWIDLYEAHLLG